MTERDILLNRVSYFIRQENADETTDERKLLTPLTKDEAEYRAALLEVVAHRKTLREEFIQTHDLCLNPVPEWANEKGFTIYSVHTRDDYIEITIGASRKEKTFAECLQVVCATVKRERSRARIRWLSHPLEDKQWLYLVNYGFVWSGGADLHLNWQTIPFSRYRLTKYEWLGRENAKVELGRGKKYRWTLKDDGAEKVVDELNAVYPPYLQRKQAFIDIGFPYLIRDEILHHLMPFFHGPLGQ